MPKKGYPGPADALERFEAIVAGVVGSVVVVETLRDGDPEAAISAGDDLLGNHGREAASGAYDAVGEFITGVIVMPVQSNV